MNVSMISKTGRGPEAALDHETGMGDEMAVSSILVSDVPPRSSTSKGLFAMVIVTARRVRDFKGFALWQFVRFAIAATYFWVGGSFLFGGDHIHVEPTYHLIENFELNIRVHGAVLFVLAFLVAARPAGKRFTAVGLLLTLFYSLMSTCLIVGGWVLHKPDLSAPAWYALIAALSFALIVSAPKTVTRPATRDGGSRA
jgi:hypothetical protein